MNQRDKIEEVLHQYVDEYDLRNRKKLADTIFKALTEGSELTRYALESDYDRYFTAEAQDGDYVRFDDAQAIIAQKDAENAELRCQWKVAEGDLHHMTAACNEAETERDALRKDDKKLRYVLGIIYSQGMAYTDDGECQDNRTIPYIDFMRDTPEKIELSIRERAVRALQRRVR